MSLVTSAKTNWKPLIVGMLLALFVLPMVLRLLSKAV